MKQALSKLAGFWDVSPLMQNRPTNSGGLLIVATQLTSVIGILIIEGAKKEHCNTLTVRIGVES